MQYSILSILSFFPGCIAVVGYRSVPRSLADAPELSSVSEVAEGAGEISRENHQTSPRLPSVAHHRSHQRLPHRHPAEISQGYSPLRCYLILKQPSLIFSCLTFFSVKTLNYRFHDSLFVMHSKISRFP